MGPDTGELLERLGSEYAAALPARLDRIEAPLLAAIEGHQPLDLEEHHRLVHQLAGSAATFGLAALGQSARGLVRTIRPLLEAGTPLASEDLLRLIDGVRQLRDRIGEPIAGTRSTRPVARATSGGRVLIVDDDRYLSRALALHLEEGGYECHLAHDAAGALEQAADIRPDLVLLDRILPDGDGLSVCRELRRMPGLEGIPIFCMTVLDDDAAVETFEAGADDHLTKPIGLEVLRAKIHRTLSRRQERRIETLADLVPGVVFVGRYRIERTLGVGGMGKVYLVRKLDDGRLVALKAMATEQHDEDDRMEERFALEIRSLQSLEHPALVRIHAAGVHHRVLYYTMDFLPGGMLGDRLESGWVPSTAEALDLIATLADALAVAHDQGIIHRDLKPANILFDENDRPVISDFGLAYVAGPSRLTRTGYIYGTPHYMSPEQIRSVDDLDGRSDLYVLGVLLHVLLTGQRPFEGYPETEVLVRTMTREVPTPLAIVPALDPDAAALCWKALALDRKDRHADVRAFAERARQIRDRLLATGIQDARTW